MVWMVISQLLGLLIVMGAGLLALGGSLTAFLMGMGAPGATLQSSALNTLLAMALLVGAPIVYFTLAFGVMHWACARERLGLAWACSFAPLYLCALPFFL
jgi:hypothetical protein